LLASGALISSITVSSFSDVPVVPIDGAPTPPPAALTSPDVGPVAGVGMTVAVAGCPTEIWAHQQYWHSIFIQRNWENLYLL